LTVRTVESFIISAKINLQNNLSVNYKNLTLKKFYGTEGFLKSSCLISKSREKMNCKKINKSIFKFIEKKLTLEREIEFKEHVEECNECAQLYRDINLTYSTLNMEQEIEPKAFFAESVTNKIDSGKTKENIFDVTLDIAISKFFKKFAYTGIAFIIALFILLYTTDNLFLFKNLTEEDEFTAKNISSVFFENL